MLNGTHRVNRTLSTLGAGMALIPVLVIGIAASAGLSKENAGIEHTGKTVVVATDATESTTAPTPSPAPTLPPVPQTSDKAISIRSLAFRAGENAVQLVDITFNLPRALRIVDMFDGVQVGGYRSYSLSEVLKATNAMVAVTGAAASSITLPSSLGLVIDNGRVASALDTSRHFASGVLCITAAGRPLIVHAKRLDASSCKQAMQSGPIVVEPGGKIGIHEEEQRTPALEHIVVATDKLGKLHALQFTPTHLYDLARYLQGRSFTAALSISSGGERAAVVVRSGSRITYQHGNLEASIPSALILNT